MKKRCPYCGKKLKKKEYEAHILNHQGSGGKSEEKGDFKCYDDCIRCCEDPGAPLELTRGDIIRIKTHLGIKAIELFEKRCFVMWNMISGTQTMVPSVGLRFQCEFLEEGRCTIYDVRPIHCHLFPEALFIDSTHRTLEAFTDTGYKCIDIGFKIGDKARGKMLRLFEIDEDETKETAEYFDNFRYSYELSNMELNLVSELLKDVDDLDKNEKRREICTDMISSDLKNKAEEDFIEKIKELDDRKDLEKSALSVTI